MKGVRLTHIGGPTALIEVGGWRPLTDPTFDAPGRTYNFGWATARRNSAGADLSRDQRELVDSGLAGGSRHGTCIRPEARKGMAAD
jgi:hypothetical protein